MSITLRGGKDLHTKVLDNVTPCEAMNEILAFDLPLSIVMGPERFYLYEEDERRLFCRGIMFATADEFKQLTIPQSDYDRTRT